MYLKDTEKLFGLVSDCRALTVEGLACTNFMIVRYAYCCLVMHVISNFLIKSLRKIRELSTHIE